MKKVNWIGVIVPLVLAIAVSGAVDRTTTERATGSDVVQSVVDKIAQTCIFREDRLFVRRMAFVETQDGKDGSTFRPSFNGGIWQISKNTYEATRACTGTLRTLCAEIKKQFNIDWQKTSWKDLLKPFYSGLAAYLYLALNKQAVPGDPAKQEFIWKIIFHTKTFTHSRNFPQVAKALSSSCSSKADVVFLLDESGSVGLSNYNKMKAFLVKAAGRLTIGTSAIRVSLVTFGAVTKVVTYLNHKQTNQEVVRSINGIVYGSGGSTRTSDGLYTVADKVFNKINGAKEAKDAPRVLVLITDGQSDSTVNTVKAARHVESNNIEIISVGVGSGIDYNELRQVASKCNHVFTVNTFDDFENFISELIKETCKASAQVTLVDPKNNGTSGKTPTKIEYPMDGKNETDTRITINNPKNPKSNGTGGQTIVVKSNCVVVKVYGSFDNQNPSESMFEITGTATDGRPVVLFVKADKQGRPLFLRFKATKLNSTEKVCFNGSGFVVKINKGKPTVGNVVCRQNGTVRNCTSVDLIESKWRDKICTRASDISTIGGNPCTAARLNANQLVFPYPNDKTKFLKCDMKGRVYVIICPPGLFYEPGHDSCGTDSEVPDTKKPLNGKNPCTHKGFLQHQVYFPYLPNHHYYVQCDQWGAAWVVPCPDEDIWDQKILQCIPENAEKKGNPCKPESIKKGIFFFPYPGDKHKYIHCTDNHNFVVQSCGEMVYDDTVHNCLPG